MELSLAEAVLLAAAAVGIYRLLRPLQRALESWLLRLLDPERARIIDADAVPTRKGQPDKE
jgi:hypothetical protein